MTRSESRLRADLILFGVIFALLVFAVFVVDLISNGVI